MASAATHAVLPLLATAAGPAAADRRRPALAPPALRRAGRVLAARMRLRARARRLLAERGIGWFCVDQSAHEDAARRRCPDRARPPGRSRFTIDWEAVSWLWSLTRLSLRPRLRRLPPQVAARQPALDDRRRRRTTRGRRAARRSEHAGEFVAAVAARLERVPRRPRQPGCSCFAIDTELLGHWWWEGPPWLARGAEAAAGGAGSGSSRCREAVARHPSRSAPAATDELGEGKDLRTWDSPEVADLAWARAAARAAAAAGARRADSTAAAAERAARELLAVQASDWAFLDRRKQAGDYPYRRAAGHGAGAARGHRLRGRPDPRMRNLAPDLSLAPLLEP